MSRLDAMKRALGQVLLWHPATGGMTIMESRELTIDLAQAALSFTDRETDVQEAVAGRPGPLSDPAAQKAVKPDPSPERESLALYNGQGTLPGTISESCGDACPVSAAAGAAEGNGLPSAKGKAEDSPAARRHTSDDALASALGISQCEDDASPASPQDAITSLSHPRRDATEAIPAVARAVLRDTVAATEAAAMAMAGEVTADDMDWAIEEAKKIDPAAKTRPLSEVVAERRAGLIAPTFDGPEVEREFQNSFAPESLVDPDEAAYLADEYPPELDRQSVDRAADDNPMPDFLRRERK